MYEFRILAYNDFGYGLPSAPSGQYSTPAEKPYKAPSNIGGGGGKSGDLTITWDPLPPADQNGPGIYYKIFYHRKKGETEFQTVSLKEYGNIGMHVVRGLSIERDYYTEFDVKVQAINALGEGPVSAVHTVYSAEDMPQVSPQQVKAFSYNSTSLNVTWQPIEPIRELTRGKLIGHRIKYWRADQTEESAVYYLSRTTRPWSLIVGLRPDSYYYVKVKKLHTFFSFLYPNV